MAKLKTLVWPIKMYYNSLVKLLLFYLFIYFLLIPYD